MLEVPMKLVWISDPHLEFLDSSRVDQFLSTLPAQGDALLITGDISNATKGSFHWDRLIELGMPTYFVLGNHDYYMGNIATVRSQTLDRTTFHPNVHWVSGNAFKLSLDTWLCGADGWGDGRAGAGVNSSIRLNDSNYIADLQGLASSDLFAKLNALGDESCQLLQFSLAQAFSHSPKTILVATHVPPFVEASLYENKPSDRGFAPHFVNQGLGAVLYEAASDHPAIDFRVYCGHTHHAAHYQPLPNLTVEVSGSNYVAEVSRILEI
jgi:Icc protein